MPLPAPLSAANRRVKDARRLSRRSERSERRLFLADGPKAVEGALQVEGCLVEVFAAPEAHLAHPGLLAACESVGVPWTPVEQRGIEALSDAVSPAGVIGVCRLLDVPAQEVLRPGRDLVAICADVRDPGNAGTVVRCADAAGVDGVVLAGSSVDLHNPKTVRASVGSVFHLPVALEPDPLAAVRAAQAAGLTVLAADGAGEVDLFEADEILARPTAWLFGNEAWGLPEELAAAADHRVAIPIHGRAESLNLATAAALCLYASARAQRT
ncbi:TrmH family RNA methyltransferase [Nocardioides bruguierae]|uniref:RNA methyltransferase n=1 Tax=Nocardioides bruguierae TaxID=2945102 RepID=A0A9X2IFT3_9ACTN|nr:RNA methyltransferase [Nocardioides bruguierae]MCM0622161.1 RNA methyltransferase [Nocardioides bruguierae]